ncbi:unnamed protein product [Protopolystoma xenopodis]|uniref:Uncharacterized protein n=1 Tax=Protopolystoma xenopodis TaxID=117903 RepID=A0A448XKF7_9PLAT|nr:unnamed protein product [Protopolystoma xenopodis]
MTLVAVWHSVYRVEIMLCIVMVPVPERECILGKQAYTKRNGNTSPSTPCTPRLPGTWPDGSSLPSSVRTVACLATSLASVSGAISDPSQHHQPSRPISPQPVGRQSTTDFAVSSSPQNSPQAHTRLKLAALPARLPSQSPLSRAPLELEVAQLKRELEASREAAALTACLVSRQEAELARLRQALSQTGRPAADGQPRPLATGSTPAAPLQPGPGTALSRPSDVKTNASSSRCVSGRKSLAPTAVGPTGSSNDVAKERMPLTATLGELDDAIAM